MAVLAPRVALAQDGAVVGERVAVAAQHPAAAEVGVRVYAEGGTVVDAAVAAVLASSVADVGRTGIGGYGGHLVYREAASGQTWLVDFPSRAPRAADERLFTPAAGDGSGTYGGWWRTEGDLNLTGALAVGVPATVAGLGAAQRRFGRLPWAAVVEPAIRLADEGITFPRQGGGLVPAQRARVGHFDETRRVFLDAWKGDHLRQPDLAGSLRVLAADGPEALYHGQLGRRIVAHLAAQGGILAEADLAAYAPQVLGAPSTEYRGCEVYAPGVGSGGGVLLALLGVLRPFDLAALGPLGATRLALLVAALGHIWPARLALAGFAPDGRNAGERLLEPAWQRAVADALRAEAVGADAVGAAALRVGAVAPARAAGPDGCTSHLSVADAAGNVVAVTTTLQYLLGSGVTVPGTGIVLNNALGLFDPHPGQPNSVGPGRTAMTNMCPTVVLRAGRPVLATGASGGRRCPSMAAQISTLVMDHGWPAERAAAAPRLHHESGPQVLLEDGFPREVVDGLRARGYAPTVKPWASDDLGGQSPTVGFAADGRPVGVPDPRRHGGAAAL